MTPQEAHEVLASVLEACGVTNKSPLKVHLDIEQEYAELPPAICIKRDGLPNDIESVEVPQVVIDAIKERDPWVELSNDDAFILWCEKKVADHNGVLAADIATDSDMLKYGKTAFFVPLMQRACTGFSYYPPESE